MESLLRIERYPNSSPRECTPGVQMVRVCIILIKIIRLFGWFVYS